MDKKDDKLKVLEEQYKNLVDCYYLLLKKFQKKSSYVLDEFLINEKKERSGVLSIYEDINLDSLHYFIVSLLDSEYEHIKQVNILNVRNSDFIVKALCFYMDNIEIEQILKKNVKKEKIKTIDKKQERNEAGIKSTVNKKKAEVKENDDEKKDQQINEIQSTENKKVLCNIKSLNIFNSNLTYKGILFLSKSLYDNGYSKLENLSIDCNSLTSECIKYLSLSLCNYNNLRTLSLQYCNLKDDSINYITNIIIYLNSNLYALNLSGNRFTDKGMTKLFESLLLNTSLDTVNVCYNMFTLSNAFVDVLGQLITNNINITTILAIGNFIDKENLEKINEIMNSNRSIATLKLPQGVDDEILKQIQQKLIRKSRKKKTKGKGKGKGKGKAKKK